MKSPYRAARRSPRRTLLRRATLTGGLALIAGEQALAQTAGPSNDSSPQSVGAAIQEILVTATRRESDISAVPYSISAFSGDSLARTDIQDLVDLAQQIPGFDWVNRGARFLGSDVPIIRGLNVSSTASGLAPIGQQPVGMYLGNSPVTGYFPLSDVARVEVLRGPQGTEYGAGALGGAVRTIPNAPELNTWMAQADSSVSRIDHSSGTGYSLGGIANVPLGDIAAVRISARREIEPGFIDQDGIVRRQSSCVCAPPLLAEPADVAASPAILYNSSDVNFTKTDSGRVALLVQPSSSWRIELATSLSRVYGNGGPVDNPTFAGGAYPLDPRLTTPAGANLVRNNPTLEPYSRNSELGSLDVTYDAGFATVSSTTTYENTSGSTTSEETQSFFTFPPLIYNYYAGNPANPRFVSSNIYSDAQHSWNEELRVVSKTGGRLDYIGGVFLERQFRAFSWNIYVPGTMEQQLALHGGVSPVTSLANGLIYLEPASQVFTEKSVFGESTWHATSRWDLTAGARVFWQDFTADQQITSYTYFFTDESRNGFSGRNQIFKLNTSYELLDNQHVYATFSQGYRRGGSNAFPTTGFLAESPDNLVYKPDKANNYEIGLKGVLPDGTRYSADLFWIDWQNAQIGLFTPNTSFPVVINSNGARSRGTELEITTPVFTPALTLTAAYAYVDAELSRDFCRPAGDFTGHFIPCGISGAGGQQLPGTPRGSASATLSYDLHLGDDDLLYTVNGSYKGTMLLTLPSVNQLANRMPAYTLLNGSISWQHGPHWRLALYGDNLTDKRAIYSQPLRVATAIGAWVNSFTISEPRQVGLRGSYRW